MKSADSKDGITPSQLITNTPHKFMNSGDQRLRQVDIHANRQFITHWLEE